MIPGIITQLLDANDELISAIIRMGQDRIGMIRSNNKTV